MRSGSSSRHSSPRAQGDPAEIVSAAEGRAALALALEVTNAVERMPVPALGR